ncbi:hypothetical protein F4823DRAFT_560779 [Ustulina deusta]|nr:hypothetical protein F4823DRAFT_560779 [Ustulina deusta]
MGHQEASPPRQRDRVPHHRRHRHRRNHNPAAKPTNRNPSLSLGRLNRDSHAPSSHAIVESWLGQLTASVPTTRLASPESRNQLAHNRKHSRSQDSHCSSCCQRPRRVDRSWRPLHIPPAQGSSHSHLPLLTNPQKKLKRYKRNSGDSSLISSLGRRRELQEWNCTETASEHEKGSRYKSLDETEVGTVGALSPMSHIGVMVPAFEKRPRHKTRPDKYDTKQLRGRKRRGKVPDQDEDQPRGSKSKKEKHVLTGKNVMKNFTSEAVTNDRITVQPNLKPGLFNNKRVPKEHPITDLSFSEMPFPAHQECDIPQHKGLSSSRLRERQRENRELERISSFFLPPYADTISRKSKPAKFKDNEAARNKKPTRSDNATLTFYPDSFTTPSSSTAPTRSYCQQSFLSPDNPCSIAEDTASGPDFHPNSSKTTYFAWSSSQHSPQARSYLVSTRSEPMESTRSATPDDIRKALATTGVYRNTGIRSYDDSHDPQKHILKTIGESPSTRSSIVGHEDAYAGWISPLDHKSNMQPRYANDTRATTVRRTRLEERWNTILPPKWKLQRSSENEMSLVDKQRDDVLLEISATADPPDRQETAEEARAEPTRELPPAHHVCHQGCPDSNTNVHRIAKSPVSVHLESGRIVDDTVPADEDQATITSRDAMPPPPIPPPRFNPSHSTNPKPGDDLGPSIRIETTRPLETHVQMSNSEQLEFIDPYKATGERHKLGGQSEKVIPTLDSVSWVPQAATSSITNYDRDKTLSRLSMRSSIYENQGKELGPNGALCLTSPPTTHLNETIADFIARIESELDESPSVNDYYLPESIHEDREFPVDQITSAYDIQNRHLPMSDGSQIDCRHIPIGVINGPEVKDVFDTGKSLHGHELAASVRERPATMPTEGQSDNDIDEFLEMSKFWRPNRFSHF